MWFVSVFIDAYKSRFGRILTNLFGEFLAFSINTRYSPLVADGKGFLKGSVTLINS